MNDAVIITEKISKLYRIGERQRYRDLREVIANTFIAPFKKFNKYIRSRKKAQDFIWALKNVSFEARRGEIVGIIGRNGAGKSTLLKILSRITPPTEGHVMVRGRVASLLEVGTGFHPELTGRDNIYLNGAIMGMKKSEIRECFDEIVAFSELERFIYTPIKHYSSGMYMRLAFAVAAHLKSEVIFVDEILAVGDASFQKKCLGKMGDVAKGGRTLLFVSHQMNQIRRLCNRCIWLDDGHVMKIGSPSETISAYEFSAASICRDLISKDDKIYDSIHFLKWEIVEPSGSHSNVLNSDENIKVRFIFRINRPIHKGNHGIALFSSDNQLIWGTNVRNIEMDKGVNELVYELPVLPLKPTIYFWQISLQDDNNRYLWNCIPELIVATKPLAHFRDEWTGILNIPYKFTVHHRSQPD